MTQILKMDSSVSNPVLWMVYGIIFVYYIIATLLPIDRIIGKIYPIFGGILVLSAIGVFAGLFLKGYPLDEVWKIGLSGVHPQGLHFFPVFFVTVACGIVSGFHSTQSTLIARTMKEESEGRTTFYNMMIAEGFIAMIWAAAAMGVMKLGLAGADTPTTQVVGIVANDLLGTVGGMIAIIGVIVLPITTGDTAMRSLRLMVAEVFHIDQAKKKNRLLLALIIFALVAALLAFSKISEGGFNILWRYFAWANQTIAVFSFAMITIYMVRQKQPYGMALVPGMFYMYVISSFILNAAIGFNLPWMASYIIGGILTVLYAGFLVYYGKKQTVGQSGVFR